MTESAFSQYLLINAGGSDIVYDDSYGTDKFNIEALYRGRLKKERGGIRWFTKHGRLIFNMRIVSRFVCHPYGMSEGVPSWAPYNPRTTSLGSNFY